jgi:hypothetical protein
MQFISKCFIFAAVFINPSLLGQGSTRNGSVPYPFSSPMNIPLLLSGNYGEIRTAHFHTGIDFKTEQVEGKMVFAVDSGSVFRVAVQSGGYGHAVYLKHPGGKVTVYGHLREFVPEIGKYVKEEQYQHRSFEVDLYPPSGLFVFRKGALIGFSGSTGFSGGPHLHFEIRDKSGSLPFNALKYNFPISDRTKPKITWLAVYPLDDSSMVNGISNKLIIPVTGSNGNYNLASGLLRLSGNIGFGIETFDYLDNSSNPCSPYDVRLYEDNRIRFRFVLDSIPFSLSSYVDSHIDYEEKIKSGKIIQKLFLDPNNRLTIYKLAFDRGATRFSDTLQHRISVSVADAYGNMSILDFDIRSAGKPVVPAGNFEDTNVVARFYYDSLNVFEEPDVRVVVPRDALFTNIGFRYSKFRPDSLKLSDVFDIHQVYTPLNKPYILSIRPRELPPALQGKVMIAGIGSDGIWSGFGGNYKNGFVTARMSTFGRFFLSLDTIAPVIVPVDFVSGKKMAADQMISFRITERQSGIRKYSGYIDKKWALFEFDAKNNLLTYTMDKGRLAQGKTHQLEIIVTDNRDNTSHFRDVFFY